MTPIAYKLKRSYSQSTRIISRVNINKLPTETLGRTSWPGLPVTMASMWGTCGSVSNSPLHLLCTRQLFGISHIDTFCHAVMHNHYVCLYMYLISLAGGFDTMCWTQLQTKLIQEYIVHRIIFQLGMVQFHLRLVFHWMVVSTTM